MDTLKYVVNRRGDVATLIPTREWANARRDVITQTAAHALAARAIRNNAVNVFTHRTGEEAVRITVPTALLDAVPTGVTKGGKAMVEKLAASAAAAREGRQAIRDLAELKKSIGF